jgi:predicted DNA-binding transcriptional regulator AlpA
MSRSRKSSSLQKKTVMPNEIKKPRHVPAPVLPQLYPHQVIRYRDAAPYFGYKHAQFDALVRSGGLPKPFPLSETGKASGYTGRMILDHLEKMQKRPTKSRAGGEAL